jgi:hypothetical protein
VQARALAISPKGELINKLKKKMPVAGGCICVCASVARQAAYEVREQIPPVQFALLLRAW